MQQALLRSFDKLDKDDIKHVGGKNASLGEMITALKSEQIPVPDGFATTAHAFRRFLADNGMESDIRNWLSQHDSGEISLAQAGKNIRERIMEGEFSRGFVDQINRGYERLGAHAKRKEVPVAVRSSATAEDLPDASFAGQQESFLNIRGIRPLLTAIKRCYASLYTDRAISYRIKQGFDHMEVALSVGVQLMVRSDKACSGVMFTLDTESGFPDMVLVSGAWGLGDNVVQGTVRPDEFRVFKPLLNKKGVTPIVEKRLGTKGKTMVLAKGGGKTTRNERTLVRDRRRFILDDDEILQLARWAVVIEEHYGMAMDIEWAKDGKTGGLYIVQARPETVHSQKEKGILQSYRLKETGKELARGMPVGQSIGHGRIQVISDASDIEEFQADNVLVTEMTDPDWVPIMKKASGIITERGGRTSHAAIVSREMGVPAIVGVEDAMEKLADVGEVTVSCAEGDEGIVYEGSLEYEVEEIDLTSLPKTRTEIMLNIARPAAAMRWWRLPVEGIGLARMEFIINNVVRAHPLALLHYDDLEDKKSRKRIRKLTRNYEDRGEYFVDTLAQGISLIAASRHPAPVIVRMSDFKSNEYDKLIGGNEFEHEEQNPMLGFRGASRYISEAYRDAFALECQAVKRVREEVGLDNVVVMIPFCRTLNEADQVLEEMANNGLIRGEKGLEVYVMAEVPSNIVLAADFARRFDGFSIGSNDLTQLVLGVDRDSQQLAHLFDERDKAVLQMIETLIEEAHAKNRKVGICGQGPSDHPDLAERLVRMGIDSISLNPDSVVKVREQVHRIEQRK